MKNRKPAAPAAQAGSPKVSSPSKSDKPAQSKQLATANRRNNSLARPSPYVSEPDFLDVLYQPHTVTTGIILVSAFIFAAGHWVAADDETSNVKIGIAAVCWVFVVFGSLHLPDGIMIRPHPFVWRAVLSLAIIYLLVLVFLVFQRLDTIHAIFAYIDPSLAEMPSQQSYATDCRISTPEEPYKFFTTVFDVFIIAHALGYWAKAMVLRDWRVVTMVSIGFELIEVTFQHILPNFAECWWDHVLADVLICNLGGTVMGILTLRYLEAKDFNWVKMSDIPTLRGKAKRLVTQFAPRSFEHYDWEFFGSFKRFCQMCILLAVMFTQELNCFALKHMLHMKPEHPLVVARLAMWGIFAIPGLREFYDYISEPKCKRIGTMAWVGAGALGFETLLTMKMIREGNYFTEPMPAYIALPWIVAIALFASWVALYFGTKRRRRGIVLQLVLQLLLAATASVLLAMCCMGNNDTQWYREEFVAWVEAKGLW